MEKKEISSSITPYFIFFFFLLVLEISAFGITLGNAQEPPAYCLGHSLSSEDHIMPEIELGPPACRSMCSIQPFVLSPHKIVLYYAEFPIVLPNYYDFIFAT